MMAMERTNPVPLYARVAEALRQEIEQSMHAGDALLTEPQLEARFGVSRITVRRALDELVSEGLVVRQQGRGTFVREQRITQDLARLMSWTLSMREMGYEPSTRHCEIDLVEPPREVASMLKLELHKKVLRVRRLRLADGEPICLMTNYIPEELAPGIQTEGLVDDSVYATLVAHGMKPERAEDKVEARPATASEAEQLEVAEWSALLQVTRLATNTAGRPLYVAVVASRADRYSYKVQFGA